MGVITISGLRLMARHGVLDQERRVGNEFEVDLRLDVPSAIGAEDSDDLSGTVNYAEVVDIVKHEMSVPSKLLEHVAARIRRAVTSQYPQIVSGEITVKKLAPPIAAQLNYVAYTTIW